MRRLPFARAIIISFILFIWVHHSCTKEDMVLYELSTSVSPNGGGSITPTGGSFEKGEEIVLTAVPSSGYFFKSWSGARSGNTNPLPLTMNSDIELSAIFEKLDTDQDGVTDDLDQCLNTPIGQSVDQAGCSDSQKDFDQDGITDDIDQCPDTEQGQTVDDNGCSDTPVDSDNDGVLDENDLCDNTPEDEQVDDDGCSDSQKDTDGDGVNDSLDQCMNTPPGTEVDEFGCSDSQTDGDQDGVDNSVDQCPNTPAGEAVDGVGCSDSQKDSDDDGISDNIDLCADTPSDESVDPNGCSPSQLDSDGDGVDNATDQCPNTPNGESVDSGGCSNSQKDSDNDGVNDADDTCPGTPMGEMVNSEGCSAGQLDNTPPNIIRFTVVETTPSSFTVDWSLDEGSKGYIRFGTAPGVYVASTAIEQNYLTRHVQMVGGSNPFPLNPNTTYYWQIFVEDQYGNSGFSMEYSTTTLEEIARTFVPDDVFEQYLIDSGYDDVLDDYVVTANIENVTTLVINDLDIESLTGIEDFISLELLDLYSLPISALDLTGNQNLLYLIFSYEPGFGINFDQLTSINLQSNTNLLELDISGASISNLDISANTSLRKLRLIDDNNLNSLDLSSNLELRELSLGGGVDVGPIFNSYPSLDLSMNTKLESLYCNGLDIQSGILDLSNNLLLKTVAFNGDDQLIFGSNPSLESFSSVWSNLPGLDFSQCPNMTSFSCANVVLSGLNLKNGNNTNMTVSIDALNILDDCVQVDDVNYANANFSITGDFDAVFSEDCGF